MLKINNPEIISFYENNPHIDFEQVNLLLVNLMRTCNPTPNNLLKEVTTHVIQQSKEMENLKLSLSNIFNQYTNIVKEDIKDSKENTFFNILNHINKSNESLLLALDKTKTQQSNDMNSMLLKLNIHLPNADISIQDNIIIIKREDKPTCVLYNFNNSHNAPINETQQFIKICNSNDVPGIFISHNSGIVNFEHFQFNLQHKNPLLFLHNCHFDHTHILLAITVIDSVCKVMNQTHLDKNISIPADILKAIYDDFTKFNKKKEELQNSLNTYFKDLTEQVNNMSLISLDKFLATFFTPTTTEYSYNCDLCNDYPTNNLRSLARHKQHCSKKEKNLTKLSETSDKSEI